MFVFTPLIIFAFIAVGNAVSDTYKVGGKAVLSPGSVSAPITSVTWKHGADIAVERYGQDTTEYRDFKGRCELNATTGALTISNLMLKDSGSYTAEINSRIMNTTEIRVFTPVPKPTISTHCNPERTECTLTCDANVTKDTGSVTYSWMMGDAVKPSATSQLNITQNDTESVGKPISCQLENPVGSERSDDIMSPFSPSSSSGSVNIAVVIVAIVVIVVIVAALVGFVIWYKHRQQNAGWRQSFARFDLSSCLNPERNRGTENSNGAVTGKSYQLVSTQDHPGPESTGTNKEAEKPTNNLKTDNVVVSKPRPADPTDPSSEAAKSPEDQEDPTQDHPGPESTGTNKEAEKPTNNLKMDNVVVSEPTPADPTDPSSEAAKSPENQTVTNQHQQEPVSTDTNNEAETPAVAPSAEEPPNQHPQQEDETTEHQS